MFTFLILYVRQTASRGEGSPLHQKHLWCTQTKGGGRQSHGQAKGGEWLFSSSRAGAALGGGKAVKTWIKKRAKSLRVIPGCVYGGILLLALRLIVDNTQVNNDSQSVGHTLRTNTTLSPLI